MLSQFFIGFLLICLCFTAVQASPIDLSLYLIADRRSASSDAEFLTKIEESIKGGVTCIQWRDFTTEYEASLRMVRELKQLTAKYGVSLIVNSRLDVALAAGVDGVFLENRDVSFEEARAFLGDEVPLSMSVESMEDVLIANEKDIDHISVKVFPSPCTSTGLVPFGIERLRAARAAYRGRIIVIGGITLENAEIVCKELRRGDGIASRCTLWSGDLYETAKKMRLIVDTHINFAQCS